jgi:hypothetical protein
LASTINSTQTDNGGIITTGDDSGILQLQTNETTAVTIDASQVVSFAKNVGIGTSSPSAVARASFGNSSAGGQSLWAAYFATNSDSASAAPNFGLTVGWNRSGGGGESNIVYGTGVGSTPALAFSSSDGTTVTERARIDPSGNLLVGTTSAISGTNTLQVVNAAGDSTQIRVRSSGAVAGRHWRYGADSGNTLYVLNQDSTGVYMGNGSTSWSGLSDARSKDIIEPITGAAEKVATLRAVIGKYKTDEEGTRRSFLIAQDVQAVLPEAVSVANQETGHLGLSYTDVIPLLTAAIQEQQAIIEQLRSDVEALKAAA